MSSYNKTILFVEDNDADYDALLRALQKNDITITLKRCITGDAALDYLSQGTMPDLILLDLNLPGTDGFEVIKTVKENPTLKKIPIVVLTTSDHTGHIEKSYFLGANGYIQKPVDFRVLMETIKSLIEYWFEYSLLPQ